MGAIAAGIGRGAGEPPVLNERAQGWLRYLWRKAEKADNWSEDGKPHPWWDRYSTDPMMSFPRFDLSESSYALGVMADQTPAWREVYSDILKSFVERHLTYWAAIDWLTHLGPDPRRKDYPEEWIKMLLPAHMVGEYDVPGWCANDTAPWGLQPDPIGADGNLFFKGWLNLTMSLHAYVSGEDAWSKPFQVAGVDGARFEWTQGDVASLLVDQWTRHPEGPHCENTKIWPFCLSAAGLGLQLYDTVFAKDTHHVYDAWLAHTRDSYFGIDAKGRLEWATFYYDPIIEYNHTLGPGGGLGVCLYMMPQAPEFAELLYRSAAAKLGWSDPAKPVRTTPDPRFLALGLVLAKEYGDAVVFERLSGYAEANFEPRRFGPANEEFGWWFQLGEDWPRGQLSALMMMAEVGGPGAWSALFRTPNLEKFDEPTVEGVDFPTLGIARAWNDMAQGALHVTTYAGDPARAGGATRFRVSGLPDANPVEVICDGTRFGKWRALDGSTIEIETDVSHRTFVIRHRGVDQGKSRSDEAASGNGSGGQRRFDAAPVAVSASGFVPDLTASLGPGCPCCL